jgi:hypothetical protein
MASSFEKSVKGGTKIKVAMPLSQLSIVAGFSHRSAHAC